MRSGFVLFFFTAASALAQYTGPAILSRGEAPAAMATPKIDFRPFVEADATYDTGLSNVGLNDKGQLANAASAGTSILWGVSGSHSWHHVHLGLDYRGGFSHFASDSGYDSLDNSLLFALTDQISPHMKFNLREAAGMMSRDFGLLNLPATIPFDPSTSFIPTTDYYDNRTYYVNSHADMALQKTSHLSFGFSGDLFATRRRSSALNSATGYMAMGDAQYRLTRRTTIGANYNYLRYIYTRGTGQTDVHGAAGSYSIRLTRWTEFSGYAGFMRVESKFVQDVPIDPAIAVLLGITSAPQIAHSINTIPNLAGRLSRTFRSGVVYLSGAHTVIPGNGLFDTSYGTTVLAGYNYTGLRRWSCGITADYMSANSVGIISGKYNAQEVSASVSRQIIHSVHFVTSYALRSYGSSSYSNYNRVIHDVRVGFGFSPGDIPLRIW